VRKPPAVPGLRKACPSCGEPYAAEGARCPACGVRWRTARQAVVEEREAQTRADGLGFGTEREAFRMGVVGGASLLILAGAGLGVFWLLGWELWSPALMAAVGVAAILHGILTGNMDGSKRRPRGGS